jgi:hypothetical protein
VLLYCGSLALLTKLFNIGGHKEWRDVRKAKPPKFAPKKKLGDCLGISLAGVGVSNISREKLDEAFGGVFSSLQDQRRKWEASKSRCPPFNQGNKGLTHGVPPRQRFSKSVLPSGYSRRNRPAPPRVRRID